MGEQFYCPQDCEGGTECGDGNCDQGENQLNCPDDCEEGGPDNPPTCDTDADCIGGQTCVDLMGWSSNCLSVCETDEDCGGEGVCKEIGAFGFTLASVCDCATDDNCGADLQCCDVPMVSESTCLTQCTNTAF